MEIQFIIQILLILHYRFGDATRGLLCNSDRQEFGERGK